MTDEPLDLAPVEARRFDALDADFWATDQLHDDDRLAITAALNDLGPLLAEVKRLRAQIDEVREEVRRLLAKTPALLMAECANAWDEGHDAGIDFTYGTYTDNPYRTQPEETP